MSRAVDDSVRQISSADGKKHLRPRPTFPKRPSESAPGQQQIEPKSSAAQKFLNAAHAVRHNKYNYQELGDNKTRLLDVSPRCAGPSDIIVTIREVCFEDLEEVGYEALSYHWGVGEAEKPVYVKNASDQTAPVVADFGELGNVANFLTVKRMWVKPNLYGALTHLRHEEETITLWVDAMSINQENREEKEKQVARMTEIYSKADGVLIWLGDEDEKSKRAMDFIPHVIDLDNLETLVNDENRRDDWRSLLHLMRSSWFSRRWVIQELALAKEATVHCGTAETHWLNFRDAISLFAQNFDRIRTHFKRASESDNDFYAIGELEPLGAKVMIDTTNNIFRRLKSGKAAEPIQGLEYLVAKLSTFESADPRDTIHALRNLAKETSRQGGNRHLGDPPRPDYKKNLLEVYVDFIRWIVKTSGSIDLLCRHWAQPERERQLALYPELCVLPSWIQQISESPYGRQQRMSRGRMGRINGDSFVSLPGEGSYNAAHGIPASVKFPGSDEFVKQVVLNPYGRTDSDLSKADRDVHTDDTTSGTTRSFENDAQDAHRKVASTENTQSSVAREPQVPPAPNSSANNNAKTAGPPPFDDQRRAHEKPNRVPAQDSKSGLAYTTTASHAKVDSAPPHSPLDIDTRQNLAYETEAVSPALKQFLHGNQNVAIEVEGLKIGKLSWVTDPIADGVIPQSALRKVGLEPDASDIDRGWRTLVAERGSDGRNPPAWYERAFRQCHVNDSPNGHINTKELLAKTQPDIVHEFLKRVQAVVWNRRFLEVKIDRVGDMDNLHGLGPSQAEVGDIVCILYGCSVPCLLRPRNHPEIGEYYTFLGEAYVYGIMDGEAIISLPPSELKKRTTTFRLI